MTTPRGQVYRIEFDLVLCRELTTDDGEDSHGFELPQEVQDIIIKKMLQLSEFKAAPIIRSVSKAWLAAFMRYPAHLAVNPKWKVSLKALCRLAPNIISLEYHKGINRPRLLQPVLKCSQLTKLVLDGQKTHETLFCIDMHYLPPNLKELEMTRVRIGSRHMAHINTPGLTCLKLEDLANDVDDHWIILNSLPQLKVSSMFSSIQSLTCMLVLGWSLLALRSLL